MTHNGFAYDTAGFERQLRQCQHFASAKEGSAACESAVGQWRRHYVIIRVTNLQLFVENPIHLTIRPAVLYAVLPTVNFPIFN